MHPNTVAPRRRANPADFPALSSGSAAPRFDEALMTKEEPSDSGVAARNQARSPKGFLETITEGVAAGRTAGALAGSRVGPVGALVGAFTFGGACIWNWSQRHAPNKNRS